MFSLIYCKFILHYAGIFFFILPKIIHVHCRYVQPSIFFVVARLFSGLAKTPMRPASPAIRGHDFCSSDQVNP